MAGPKPKITQARDHTLTAGHTGTVTLGTSHIVPMSHILIYTGLKQTWEIGRFSMKTRPYVVNGEIYSLRMTEWIRKIDEFIMFCFSASFISAISMLGVLSPFSFRNSLTKRNKLIKLSSMLLIWDMQCFHI